MITKTDLAKILTAEFVFFQNIKVTPELISAWYSHFHTVTKEEFAASMHLAVAESKGFPPTPAHVWEMLKTLKTDPDTIETCEQAWYSVITNKKPSERALTIFKLIPDYKDHKKWDSKTASFKKRDFEAMWINEQQIDRIVEKQKIAREELGFNSINLIASQVFKKLAEK